MPNLKNGKIYLCPKCNCNEYTTGKIRTAGGGLSRFFDVQNNKFETVSCKKCGYTELYKRKSGTFGNMVDFLMSE